MSELLDPGPASSARQDPETLVLRGRPRPVVRFRRGLIVGITGAIAAGLVGISWMALERPSLRNPAAPIESDEQSPKATPDALSGAPKNYGDVPRLGPPLPGDLGRPILEQERSLEERDTGSSPGSAGEGSAQSAAEPGRERAEATRIAARTAGLMVQLGSDEPKQTPSEPLAANTAVERSDSTKPSQAAVPASQQHKLEFSHAGNGPLIVHQLSAPPSPFMLSAGTVVPASLITGLNSDLPGMVIAQVTQNVRDSASGQWVLIPQGARLIGKYDSVVAFGQRRALLIWTRIVLPDGSSVELDHMPATDASGYSGLSDGVDSHTWQLLKGIGMATLLGVGTQLSFGGSGSSLVRAIRESAQENAAHAGDQITSRNLDIQPTITVRPGWPVTALINQDLILQPWRG